ncbi:MAG: GNAT family N-acetyltransferase [Burkholderiales bacterium PBB3]|nr:MAG: GNAT family N-acetyltransferase [Burkholderiales bacterium PBB3]
MPPLFQTQQFAVRELSEEQIPTLQALFEANPDYFLSVNGLPPGPTEAQREFEELPPSHLSYGARWFAGVFDQADALRGVIILVSDLAAKGVWHTALFFLERSLRGTGAANELHRALEATARKQGAQWLRLGVVAGNLRAERFWSKCGYKEVRTRAHINAAGEAKITNVLVKSLYGGDLRQYLQLVPRDAPNSQLP